MSLTYPHKLTPTVVMDRASPGVPEDDGMACSVAAQDADASFFKVISENLKYAFNSPLPTTQFPTPYSNQTQQQGGGHFHHHNQQQQQQQQSQQQQAHGVAEHGIAGRTQAADGNSDSSLVENSMLAGLPSGVPAGPSGEPLSDMNMQPSSMLQFGNNFSNEFLLASPEQFREFLLDSPAGFNFFHKTPAKTPLRFVTDAKGGGDMFDNENNGNVGTGDSNDNANGGLGPDNNENNTQTPLRNIDLNLMFNSNQMTSSSPSKKFSVSLTPYGRRVLNDMGTSYAKNLLSSNSALADFQKARKHNVKLQTTPPNSLGSYHHRSIERAKSGLNNQNMNSFYRDHDALAPTREENDENDLYGSSPTTIQLNSSVTKSTIKIEPSRIPPLSKVNTNIDEQLFSNDDDRLPVSPTPKCHNNSSSTTMDTLRIPELPKMGSFKSDSSLLTSAASNASHQHHHLRHGKVKKSNKKQPKFQIIVANTQKFNVPTMSQRSTKKNGGGLKRSQSLLSGSSASTSSNSSNKSQQKTPGAGNSSSSLHTDRAKRSNSFTSGKGQFRGFQ